MAFGKQTVSPDVQERAPGKYSASIQYKAHKIQRLDLNSSLMDRNRNYAREKELQDEINWKPPRDVSQYVDKLEWYNVLWIENKDGISYRRACGWVPKHVWEASALEIVEIQLG